MILNLSTRDIQLDSSVRFSLQIVQFQTLRYRHLSTIIRSSLKPARYNRSVQEHGLMLLLKIVVEAINYSPNRFQNYR